MDLYSDELFKKVELNSFKASFKDDVLGCANVSVFEDVCKREAVRSELQFIIDEENELTQKNQEDLFEY